MSLRLLHGPCDHFQVPWTQKMGLKKTHCCGTWEGGPQIPGLMSAITRFRNQTATKCTRKYRQGDGSVLTASSFSTSASSPCVPVIIAPLCVNLVGRACIIHELANKEISVGQSFPLAHPPGLCALKPSALKRYAVVAVTLPESPLFSYHEFSFWLEIICHLRTP